MTINDLQAIAHRIVEHMVTKHPAEAGDKIRARKGSRDRWHDKTANVLGRDTAEVMRVSYGDKSGA